MLRGLGRLEGRYRLGLPGPGPLAVPLMLSGCLPCHMPVGPLSLKPLWGWTQSLSSPREPVSWVSLRFFQVPGNLEQLQVSRCRCVRGPDRGAWLSRPREAQDRSRGCPDPGRPRCRGRGGPDPGRPRYRSWGGPDPGQVQVHGKEISRPWLGPVPGAREAQVKVLWMSSPREVLETPRCCNEVYSSHRGGPGPGAGEAQIQQSPDPGEME